ncbi:GvpL/GvpF family gas vesicle protein [Prolixibacteraceae bacterium JC049]|nr:GvpL/GvpF family gas vesicle protein [Prolixibacteraceae bacterium JC049]
MENQSNNIKEGKYIYCIIKHDNDIQFGPIGIGKRNDQVYGICYENLCAIVSNTPVIQYETRRVHITAHERVLEKVMKQFSVLPARYSTIADTSCNEDIAEILKRDYDRIYNLLDQVEGKKELGLKVLAKEKVIYPRILNNNPDIARLRNKLQQLPVNKTHYQRVKIGEMVETALEKEKEKLKAQILTELKPYYEKIKVNDNYGELMLLNAAFLLSSNNESLFDEAINNIDKKLGDILIFKYVGELPPYNFVNLKINLEENLHANH